MGPMTQARSRMLGRALMAIAAMQQVMMLRQLGRRSFPVWVLLALFTAPLSALLAWVGYTLATMDWDHPADYPPPD
jgi:hypothetical protein